MNRMLLILVSLLAMLFFPALIKSPDGEPYLLINHDKKALLYTITYTGPYHELLKQLSTLWASTKAKEVEEVYVWQDSQGNLHFSDQQQAHTSTYQVENQYTGRLAFPLYWVWGFMLAIWLVIYLLLQTPVLLFRRYFDTAREKKPVHPSGLNIHLNRPQQEAPPEPDTLLSPYQVLGVSERASNEEIKAAYRNKIRQYHPDRVAHLGKELQAVAKKKSLEINQAYESLRIK